MAAVDAVRTVAERVLATRGYELVDVEMARAKSGHLVRLYVDKPGGIGLDELSDVTEDIKRRLLKVPMVKKVDVIGKQAKKVYVEFSHERLAKLGITPAMIAESLRN